MELWPDRNEKILLEHFDALKPEISSCGLYFWVIVSSLSHMHTLPSLVSKNHQQRKIAESEVGLSLWNTHLTEQTWKLQEMSKSGASPGPCKPSGVNMGHATLKYFWKAREKRSKASGIIRHLLHLAQR